MFNRRGKTSFDATTPSACFLLRNSSALTIRGAPDLQSDAHGVSITGRSMVTRVEVWSDHIVLVSFGRSACGCGGVPGGVAPVAQRRRGAASAGRGAPASQRPWSLDFAVEAESTRSRSQLRGAEASTAEFRFMRRGHAAKLCLRFGSAARLSGKWSLAAQPACPPTAQASHAGHQELRRHAS